MFACVSVCVSLHMFACVSVRVQVYDKFACGCVCESAFACVDVSEFACKSCVCM